MITKTFGDLLFYPESQTTTTFPSPQFLMNRIIISTKLPEECPKSKGKKNKEVKGISKSMKILSNEARCKTDPDYNKSLSLPNDMVTQILNIHLI